jgi:hypothetical protein
MAKMCVSNPVAQVVTHQVQPAARPPSLEGKTVGLVWNLKAGGDIALERVAEQLRDRFHNVRFVAFHGAFGGHRIALVNQIDPGEADRIAAQCDVVVGTTAD